MKIIKKILQYIFDKDVWISGTISGIAFALFIVIGGYVLFITSINPWWLKLIFVAILAVVLYVLSGVTDRFVYKKLGRTSPKASYSKTKKL
jgi:branched-subunit amino acid ABC-type transport system permease component